MNVAARCWRNGARPGRPPAIPSIPCWRGYRNERPEPGRPCPAAHHSAVPGAAARGAGRCRPGDGAGRPVRRRGVPAFGAGGTARPQRGRGDRRRRRQLWCAGRSGRDLPRDRSDGEPRAAHAAC
ncbi:hypothetical protein G6F59_018421 [Rhizopus arrhizus]|nr:hypothetical protein G6F59_018421 [Rhizopus arrhizus]